MRARIIIAAAALVTMSTGCLEPVEPTPQSAVVKINAISSDGVELADSRVVRAGFDIVNVGPRRIYIDVNYHRLEKLVDQKWKLAAEETGPFRTTLAGLGAGRSAFTMRAFVSDPTGPNGIPLIAHVRGLYRMRFRISFTQDGSDLLPAEESYSQPFAVTCC